MRRVEIVAQDPSVRRNGEIVTAWITIPYEDLELGPMGYAVHVVDYDASSQTMYSPAEMGAGRGDRGAAVEPDPRRSRRSMPGTPTRS